MATSSHPSLRLAVIGAGHHSRTFHLPALAHYRRAHPNDVTLAGLVDPDLPLATAAAAGFGFEFAAASTEEMLARARPDACLVLTPVALNARVAAQLARERLAVLMEKPPGATIGEARRLAGELAASAARVMVSMNRRFDPLLRAARDWIGPRPIRHIEARMARVARTEPEFVEHTGLHLVDVVRSIGGSITRCVASRRPMAGGNWFAAELTFANGAAGSVDLMPTAAATSESLTISGDGFRVEICSAEFDRGGWRAWSGTRLERDETVPPATPMFIANGTFAETEAFIRALRQGSLLSPTPADVLASMEICHQIATAPSASPLPP